MQIFCLIGPPCAGKGTQAALLERRDDFVIIGAGNLLRKISKTDPQCAQLVNSGQLVPAEYIWKLIESEIKLTTKVQPQNHIILDGYPREIEQAKLLENFINQAKYQLHLVCMTTSNQRLLERMLDRVYCPYCDRTDTHQDRDIICCNHPMIKRKDDHEEAFDSRINIFLQNIQNIQSFFHNKPNCTWHEFAIGNETIEQVDQRFHKLIDCNKIGTCHQS